jgi:hypothetical protein
MREELLSKAERRRAVRCPQGALVPAEPIPSAWVLESRSWGTGPDDRAGAESLFSGEDEIVRQHEAVGKDR